MLEEIAQSLEKAKLTSTKIENVVWFKTDQTALDKTLRNFIADFQQKHNTVLPITNSEETIELPNELKQKANLISIELNLDKSVKEEVENLLHKIYVGSTEKIHIAKSSENEFLIYTFKDGTYKNLLIDPDGDVEILIIPNDRRKTISKRFYKEDGINFPLVIRSLNEMR